MARRFDKVLVANRGEIAVRVIRGVQEMGLKAVAVYSEADRGARHVRCADEAYAIGGAAPAESYLNIARLLEVCARSGAQAVHPGYGFLSENAAFARAIADAGRIFIGPPASAIEAMGIKTQARALMTAAGVPVTPGSDGAIDDASAALEVARRIGFPVLAKAAAGGGGKGMRRIDDPARFIADFDACRREAQSAFGDGRVYLEKFIVEPRHVELQVLADEHGAARHLFERDCSIQRRHQKVIEEAPCPVLRPEVREAMGAVAVRAAQAVGYVGAGTVEFLIDVEQRFYFLEMNTRLQVEHPITEMITGVDLVRAQLEIAQGEPIGWAQEALAPRGAALECRIYAEDPEADFMPSPGPIAHLREPGGPFVRNDCGFESGDVVPVHYDPLISKLVVWGEDRAQAIGRMRRALDDYVVQGIQTNIPFHRVVLDDPAFIAGRYTTGYIEALRAAGRSLAAPPPPELAEVAAIAAALHEAARRPAAAGDAEAGAGETTSARPAAGDRGQGCSERPARVAGQEDALKRTFHVDASGDALAPIEVEGGADGVYQVTHGEVARRVDARVEGSRVHLIIDGRSLECRVEVEGALRRVWVEGHEHAVRLLDERALRRAQLRGGDAADEARAVESPMMGRVIKVLVAPGDAVLKGQGLLIIEAMKMENELRAPADATVALVTVGEGAQVERGQVLVTFEG